MEPPKTTDGITPRNLAATPLSNCPSSLLELMNILFTLNTRPRMWAGVFNCRIVPRITTLIPSTMPPISNAAKDNQNTCDKANTIIQVPKPATANINFLPCCFCSGNTVKMITTQMAPMSVAAFNQPKPVAPTLRIYPLHKWVSWQLRRQKEQQINRAIMRQVLPLF